jgi:hypothetical protein
MCENIVLIHAILCIFIAFMAVYRFDSCTSNLVTPEVDGQLQSTQSINTAMMFLLLCASERVANRLKGGPALERKRKTQRRTVPKNVCAIQCKGQKGACSPQELPRSEESPRLPLPATTQQCVSVPFTMNLVQVDQGIHKRIQHFISSFCTH